jgi:hypothetical protein
LTTLKHPVFGKIRERIAEKCIKFRQKAPGRPDQ